ncbi:TPA: hypothetical protein ACPZPV_002247 [Yersinia enterocolitica]|nr:hypothetical protein [Yersinia enterocolitica]ELI8371622.1 hypothetical protein [Yersinia enterocolitica]
MKALDSFTVERLEEFIRQPLENGLTRCEQMELARIALAAKRADPIYQYQSGVCTFDDIEWVWDDCDKGFYEQYDPTRRRIVYTTPRLNSPEVSDGWKLVPIEPTQNMVDAHISGMQLAGFSRAYRDMLAAAPEPQNQQQNIPEIIPQGWTSSDPANAALVMLDRIDTMDSADDDRIEDIKLIIRQLAAAPEKENG